MKTHALAILVCITSTLIALPEERSIKELVDAALKAQDNSTLEAALKAGQVKANTLEGNAALKSLCDTADWYDTHRIDHPDALIVAMCLLMEYGAHTAN